MIVHAVAGHVLVGNPLCDILPVRVVAANRGLQLRHRLVAQVEVVAAAPPAGVVAIGVEVQRHAERLTRIGADKRIEPPAARLLDRRPAAGVEVVIGPQVAAGAHKRAPVVQKLDLATDEVAVVEQKLVAVELDEHVSERGDAAEVLRRVGLGQVEAAVDLGLVDAAAEEAQIGVAEIAVEVIVVAKHPQMLAAVVEIGDAAEASLHFAANRGVRGGPLPVPVVLVAGPTDGVVNGAGIRIEVALAQHRRTAAADGGATRQILLHTADVVRGQRLDQPLRPLDPAAAFGGELHQGVLAIGQRGQAAVRPPPRLAGDLGRPQDGGRIGPLEHGLAVGHGQPAGALADAPRVKHRHLAVRRDQRAAVFDEERPLLGKERFEHAQVEHRGILLDLTEVGIDRRRQRRRGAQTHAEVDAARQAAAEALVGDMFLPPQQERLHLEPPRRRRRLGKCQVTETRHEPLRAARRGHPAVDLGAPNDVAAHVEAPGHRLAGRDAEPQLREGNAELGRPPFRRPLGLHFPDGVVIRTRTAVVKPGQVALHARRVRFEGVGRQVIVPRIETDPDQVAARIGVAAAEGGGHLRDIPHVVEHGDVDRPIVVGHLDQRPLGRRGHVVGIVLDHIVDGLRPPPDLVVQAAVDARRGVADVMRVQLLAGLLGNVRFPCPSRPLREGSRGHGECRTEQDSDKSRAPPWGHQIRSSALDTGHRRKAGATDDTDDAEGWIRRRAQGDPTVQAGGPATRRGRGRLTSRGPG